MTLVSFITPTIPERSEMLKELVESIARMSKVKLWQVEHLCLLDPDYEGCSKTMNRLARMAKGEWLVPIADDDLVLPWFLTDHAGASEGTDIVYAPPLVTGANSGGHEQFWQEPPNIPAVALIRKSLWDDIGGYSENHGNTEDMILFGHAMERNARFRRVDRSSWVYRFGPHGNKSRGAVFGPQSTER